MSHFAALGYTTSTEALISRLASSLEPRFNRFPALSSTNMPVNCQTPDSAYWGNVAVAECDPSKRCP